MMMPHSQVNRLLVDFEYGTEAAKKVTEGRFYLDLIFKLTPKFYKTNQNNRMIAGSPSSLLRGWRHLTEAEATPSESGDSPRKSSAEIDQDRES